MKRKILYRTLKEWRKAKKLNQRTAAVKLGLSQSDYSRFERQIRAPKPIVAKSISDRTRVPLESVLGLAS